MRRRAMSIIEGRPVSPTISAENCTRCDCRHQRASVPRRSGLRASLEQLAPLAPDAKILVDARHCRFATPAGLTSLLCLAQSRVEKPDFAPPDGRDGAVLLGAVAVLPLRRGALHHPRHRAEAAHGAGLDTVLEVTPIAKSEDVHAVVERVKDRATHILTTKLHLEPRATMGFAMSLSEACQNIVEHAGRGGWVMCRRTTGPSVAWGVTWW
jgi:hypothetical protein